MSHDPPQRWGSRPRGLRRHKQSRGHTGCTLSTGEALGGSPVIVADEGAQQLGVALRRSGLSERGQCGRTHTCAGSLPLSKWNVRSSSGVPSSATSRIRWEGLVPAGQVQCATSVAFATRAAGTARRGHLRQVSSSSTTCLDTPWDHVQFHSRAHHSTSRKKARTCVGMDSHGRRSERTASLRGRPGKKATDRACGWSVVRGFVPGRGGGAATTRFFSRLAVPAQGWGGGVIKEVPL